MAEHPVWHGQLRLALVSCPVALHAAHRDSGNLHFHFINPETGHRVRTVTLDAETGDELARSKLARGYEFKKDHYVIVEETDFEQARLPSSATMTITKFVKRDSIDPVYFDASYYLVPDGDTGADVYAVVRDALAASGQIALSRIVIARRERPVALLSSGRGLILHTLHQARNIADPSSLFDFVPTAASDPEMVQLARQLITRQAGRFEPDDAEDRYQERLRRVIEAKVQGQNVQQQQDEPEPSTVIDLMAALKNSLARPAPTLKAPKPANDKGTHAIRPAQKSARSAKSQAPSEATPRLIKHPARRRRS